MYLHHIVKYFNILETLVHHKNKTRKKKTFTEDLTKKKLLLFYSKCYISEYYKNNY
jgi:hypothetical protein